MSTLADHEVTRDVPRVQVLDEADRAEVAELVRADAIVNVVVHSRLQAFPSLEPRRFGGSLIGIRDDTDRLVAAAFSGGNLLPLGGTPEHCAALARYVASRPRVCTSIVGRRDAVHAMWDVLEPVWGAARSVRTDQPLLVLDRAVVDRPAEVGLRTARPEDLDRYLPAAAAMFTEELGVSPFAGSTAGGYRSRIRGLLREGRAFCVTDKDGDVLFKADLGAVSPRTCQVQGVWVRPDLRGQGLGTAAMVGVLDHALQAAPTASLYVNDFNVAARRMYATLGMQQIATLATVLL